MWRFQDNCLQKILVQSQLWPCHTTFATNLPFRLLCNLMIAVYTPAVSCLCWESCVGFAHDWVSHNICNQLALQISLQSHDGSVHTRCNLPMLGVMCWFCTWLRVSHNICNQLALQTSLQSHDSSVHTRCNLPMLRVLCWFCTGTWLSITQHLQPTCPSDSWIWVWECVCMCVRLSQKCVLPSQIAKKLVAKAVWY